MRIDGEAGALTVYAAGEGPPLLLIHSVNAAASAAEVRPLYEHYQRSRRVYAFDLPGYGLSSRSDRPYSIRLMTGAINAVTSLIREQCGAAACDALALSLSSEFLARASLERPGFYRSLALVSPTGFNAGTPRRGPAGASVGKPWLHRVLRGPGWGGPLFRALTRPAVIRYFLARTWGSKNIDETLWRYDILTARQPGAQHAPLYFLSAMLFAADIQDVYERLELPVWVSHGVRGDFTNYRNLKLLERRPNWTVTVFQTGALPQFEVLEEFCLAYDRFLKDGIIAEE